MAVVPKLVFLLSMAIKEQRYLSKFSESHKDNHGWSVKLAYVLWTLILFMASDFQNNSCSSLKAFRRSPHLQPTLDPMKRGAQSPASSTWQSRQHPEPWLEQLEQWHENKIRAVWSPPRSTPFNTLPHASVQLKSCIFLLEEPIVELPADRLGDGRCSKMFEDVRRCSCYIPWDFPEKKKFKFCNLEIYGNLQSLAKWTAAMFWTSLLLVVELIDIPGRCSVQLIPNYSGFKALVKQKGRPWPFPMDFGDLPSGLEQKNVQSEHRSQKHRLLCADGCSNIRTSPPRCNWPEFKKGRKKWSKSQSLGKVWKVWLFWLVQRMAQRMARICSLPHCGAYLRAVRSPHLASAEPQLF